jgi:3-oxoacyl-[acyl-carrier-protein] synthase-1/3-oxoacyl-[acyl-carrier-protein] synthase II
VSDRSKVAITGLGCVCSLGKDVKECRDAMFRTRRLPGAPTVFKSSLDIVYPVFEADACLPSESPGVPFGLTRTSALALAAAEEALRDAGFLPYSPGPSLRIGVIVGTTVGSMFNNLTFYEAFVDGRHSEITPVLRFLANNPADVICDHYRFSGPCQTIGNACASGTDAIGIGASWIQSDLCDVVVAGGADELSRVTYNGFTSLMVTDDQPCSPFDRNRKGLNLGEGAGFLVLESDRLQKRHADRVKGYVTGYGAGCDAYHLTAPSPEGTGLRSALTQALEVSGSRIEDVAFVNAHGTGTQDNDKVESKVLHDMLPDIPFLSTKGFTGHTLGAAGAIEAILTLISLEKRMIPASPGFAVSDPDLPATPVKEAREIREKAALSESLAFGGHNSVIVLEAPRG